MNRATLRGISSAVVAIVVFHCATAAQGAKFIGLGDLPGGFFSSTAYGVSANGSVVVGQSWSASGIEAFRWTSGGGMVGLGDLPGGGFESRAYGVSADGSVVVGSGISGSEIEALSGIEAFRGTSGGGMVGLGDLPGGEFDSLAYGVSADGSVIVGRSWSASGQEASRWTSGGGMVGLGDLPGGFFSSTAYGVSANGSVVVGQSWSASGFEAFRWTSGGGMVGLGDLSGGDFESRAYDVSADGSVVVGGSISASGQEAFRWTSGGGMVGLGDLPGGSFDSNANGVSADGSVVVGYGNSASGQEAFIWDAANGMRSVRDVLSPSVGAALALNGWSLREARGVSADGRTVVGFGADPNGNQQAWLAYLADEIHWFPNASGSWDSSLSWSGPWMPGATDDVIIDPTSAATVTGPYANTTVNSLDIGGSGVGRVTLSLTSPYGGDLHVSGYAELHPNGELVLAGGRTFSAGAVLYNSGVIRGAGTVHANLLNYAGGEVRVAAGEALVVSGGGHTNSGKLEAIGGSLEFLGTVANSASTGLITGRNATLRFRDGLTNAGSLNLSFGTSDIFGDIANHATGKIVVAGNSQVTFYDDVANGGMLNVAGGSTAVFFGALSGNGNVGSGSVQALGDLAPGASPGVMQFGGDLALGALSLLHIELAGTTPGIGGHDQIQVAGRLSLGGGLQVSLIGGFNPTTGQSFKILDWTTLNGAFSSIALPVLTGGKTWNTSQLYTTGVLSVAGTLVAGDFDGDGDVDGADFVAWQTNFPKSSGATLAQGDADGDGDVDGADFVVWQTNFPFTPAPGASPVPEPSAFALAMLFAVALLWRRKVLA